MKSVFYLTIALIIAGCGATGPKFTEAVMMEIGDQSEVIVFRRDQLVDGGACYTVYLNGDKMGVLANGGFLRSLLRPGEYEISIPHVKGKVLAIRIKTKKGGKSFIEYNSALTGLSAIPAGSIVVSTVSYRNTLAEVNGEYALPVLMETRDSSINPSCMATLR